RNVPDNSRGPTAGARGSLCLRDWLVAQIESGCYPGLHWEDTGKTLFHSPWKHIAKQCYQVQKDTVLFRAWAVYKGKHLEDTNREDPPALHCALNKSADFCKVCECSQLDVSNPYKVYRIVPSNAVGPGTLLPLKAMAEGGSQSNTRVPYSMQLLRPVLPLKSGAFPPASRSPLEKRLSLPVGQTRSVCPSSPCSLVLLTQATHWPHPLWCAEPGRAQGGASLCLPPKAASPDSQNGPGGTTAHPTLWSASCWLHVQVFYRSALVQEATARTAEGCSQSPRAAAAAAFAERLLEPSPPVAQVCFPEPPPGAHVLQRLLWHLERGLRLWVAPEGVFAKRLCEGLVYWRGRLAPHRAQPNKLERQSTCQLPDTLSVPIELCAHLQDGHSEPEYQIHLCFGEEYSVPLDQPEERLVTAHVEPVFTREL
uniref:IRF tryptophan pentad repeat domain-containing protein n=1 Tax=Otolemur garnettii TaxID=30611 RepID=H0XX08_OTOGA